jgi:hypothetical protein
MKRLTCMLLHPILPPMRLRGSAEIRASKLRLHQTHCGNRGTLIFVHYHEEFKQKGAFLNGALNRK